MAQDNIIELGTAPDQDLTFEQATALVKRREPINGIILFECPCGCGSLGIINFGDVTNRDALWFSEHLKMNALLGDEEEVDE